MPATSRLPGAGEPTRGGPRAAIADGGRGPTPRPAAHRREARAVRAARGSPRSRGQVRDALRGPGVEHLHPARVAYAGGAVSSRLRRRPRADPLAAFSEINSRVRVRPPAPDFGWDLVVHRDVHDRRAEPGAYATLQWSPRARAPS